MASAPSNNFDFQNFYSATLQSDITSGSLSLTLDNVPTPTEGILVIEPDSTSNREIIFYTGKTASTVTLPSDGRGWDSTTATAHLTGSTIIMAPVAYMLRMLKTGSLYDSYSTGWTSLGQAPNAVVANGNRSYTLTFPSTVAASLSPGMRLRSTRTVAAPTQCTSLNGSTQYYSKAAPAGYTFTDSFTYSAWVKPTSYALGTIIGRFSTTGSMLQMNASGQLLISAKDAGTTDSALTYQSLPLNKWSHVAMTMVVATNTVTAYIDGVAVPTAYTNGTTTAVTQAGSLEVGGNNGGTNPFPGKIAQAAVYNAVLSNATILASMTQGLAGTETSLISAYSFNNSINDLNANANNLTANGSAVATNADSPFGGQADGTISPILDYAIVTKVATTSVTCQVPEGCTLPTSGGITSMTYSVMKAPYGMPVQRGKWRINLLWRTDNATASNATFAAFTGMQLVVPIGEWTVGYNLSLYNATVTSVFWNLSGTSITGLAAAATDPTLQARTQSSAAALYSGQYFLQRNDSLAAATTYLMYTLGATTSAGIEGSNAGCEVFAECGHL